MLSPAHVNELRLAVREVSRLLDENHLTSEGIKNAYRKLFETKDAFAMLKGKSAARFNTNIYPALTGAYFAKDIASAAKQGLQWQDAETLLRLASNDSVLTRLLAAYIWKRGELDRVKHVLLGIEAVKQPDSGDVVDEDDNNDDDGSDGNQTPEPRSVMRQFGKHLADRVNEPICDQHTFRAMVMLKTVAQNPWDHEQQRYRSLSAAQIDDYRVWWAGVTKSMTQEVRYELDKLLFSLGKAALPPRKSRLRGTKQKEAAPAAL